MIAVGSFTGLVGVILTAALVLLLGCISIPETNAAVSMRGHMLEARTPRPCGEGLPRTSAPDSRAGTLDPAGFRVMIWNGMKNGEEAWEKDFLRSSHGSELVMMQEAYLTDTLLETLGARNYAWDMSVAFRYLDRETGVLTASKVPSDSVCVERVAEPLLRTPKSLLVTRYALAGLAEELLIINVHSINFTLDTAEFLEQLRQIEPLVAFHRGPIVFAGDFNTWSDERLALVKAVTEALGLEEVTFPADDRSTFFGHRVDHVFFRGLAYDQAEVVRVTASDHNPLRVRFRLPGV